MKLLKVEALVAGWQQPVTSPVSFELSRGEVLGVAGPNGVGKSTLLAAIAGTGKVFSGSVTRQPGTVLSLFSQKLPPVYGLPLSGADLLSLTGAGTEGLPAWLSGCLGVRLDRLSGGQRQYLALWAVLQAPGDIFLLDEPSNNLDVAGMEHLQVALKQRTERGAGVVLVSHDAELLSRCCHRQLLLGERHG
ncbi:MAG: ATP-binding cassette domain-containing protein [Azovibrio sp.]